MRYVVPFNKFDYKEFPIKEDDPYIEITDEEYVGLDNHTMCFTDDLKHVILYVPTEQEKQKKYVEEHNYEIEQQIIERKVKLSETDYVTLKYMEGQMSETDYNSYKTKRQKWRDEINEFEKQIIIGEENGSDNN